MSKPVQTYENEALVVRYDPNLCTHAAECVRGLPSVFNVQARPWVNVNGATVEEIRATIARCPSGALTYEILPAK